MLTPALCWLPVSIAAILEVMIAGSDAKSGEGQFCKPPSWQGNLREDDDEDLTCHMCLVSCSSGLFCIRSLLYLVFNTGKAASLKIPVLLDWYNKMDF